MEGSGQKAVNVALDHVIVVRPPCFPANFRSHALSPKIEVYAAQKAKAGLGDIWSVIFDHLDRPKISAVANR